MKSKSIVKVNNVSVTTASIHEARRMARIYSAVHDISYSRLIGMALDSFIDKELLKKDIVSFLKERNLSGEYSDSLLK